jgi:ATP-binding cassette, subfamily G (WHITE), member 2, SNQ2
VTRERLLVPKSKPVQILKELDGLVILGEMVLVLGRLGSGCSTFLKTIADHTKEYTEAARERLYGGIPGSEFSRLFPSEAIFCSANDVHLPSLTVEQTLSFALDTKIPGNRATGHTPSFCKNEVLSSLLNMFSQSQSRKTIVGGARLRGISGGERKEIVNC